VKAEHLEKEFASRRVPYRDGLLLLPPADAIALVQRAADEGVPILAVDGLRLTEAATESPVEHLVDFSRRVADGHGCWEEAEAFIRARGESGLVFELMLGNDPLEAV
jgi:hypothetical protein